MTTAAEPAAPDVVSEPGTPCRAALESPVSPRMKRIVVGGLILSVLLFDFATVTRARHYSHDSYFYMHVAQRIAEGQGITVTMHDTNELPRLKTLRDPLPVTVWPPLYPLLVAAVYKAGVHDLGTAALSVTVFFYAVILWAMYKLVRQTHGEAIALLATSFLTICGSLTFVASYALSETTAIAFAAITYYLVARPRTTRAQRIALPLLAGAFGGLAFDTRYAMLWVVGIAGLLLFNRKDLKNSLVGMALFGVGFVAVVSPVMYRNLILIGNAAGDTRFPSERGLLLNFFDLGSCFTYWMLSPSLIPGALQVLIMWPLLLACVVSLAFRRVRAAIRRCCGPAFWHGQRKMLTLWGLGYLVVLLYVRTTVALDHLGPRLGAPGVVPIMVPVLAFAMCVFKTRTRTVVIGAYVFLALGLALGLRYATVPARTDVEALRQDSERFDWLVKNTNDRDLIIGDSVQTIPFYFPERTALKYHYAAHVKRPFDYQQLVEIAGQYGKDYDRIFFAPLRSKYTYEKVPSRISPLVADLEAGNAKNYPALKLRAELKDGVVYELDRSELPTPAK